MGMGDQLEYMNEVNWPLAKIKNRSFLIDMLFELNDEDEVSLLWYQGVVTQLLTKPINNNIKPINVMVKWNEDCISPGDGRTTKEKLKAIKIQSQQANKRSMERGLKAQATKSLIINQYYFDILIASNMY